MRILTDLVLDSYKDITTSNMDQDLFPINPRQGQLCFSRGILFIYATINQLESWFPLNDRITYYVHQQDTASTIWNVHHSLNISDLIYIVFDEYGYEQLVPRRTVIDNNTFTLNFNEVNKGKVVIFPASKIANGASIFTDEYANTSIGRNSFLPSNYTFSGEDLVGPSSNTVYGYAALSSNLTGNYNTAIGAMVLSNNTTGDHNTAYGYEALYSNSTGNYNLAIGPDALYSNTTGEGNIAIGATALYENTTGEHNIAIGLDALRANVNGSNNIAVGGLEYNTTGCNNIAVGGLTYNTTGNNNITIGGLKFNTTGSYNIAIGDMTLGHTDEGESNYNIAIGYQALFSNTFGDYNTACGINALGSNQIGSYNTALGYQAGNYSSATTGSNNIFIGHNVSPTTEGESDTIRIGTTQSQTFIAGITASDLWAIPGAAIMVVTPDGRIGRVTLDDLMIYVRANF